MSDVSWVRLLPEVGEPILHRLRLIETRELAVAASWCCSAVSGALWCATFV